jgi:hypothetical protein
MEHTVHWTGLTHDIAAAARQSFSDLLARHGDEAFYAFVLYTDADCYTVVPAANSLQQCRAKLDRLDDADPGDLAYYRWASAEWAYEAHAAEPFDPICERLSAACAAVSGDAAAFAAFKAHVHQAMIDALKQLDDEGFFGQRRDDAVLFITSSDADEAEAMENRSAAMLNRPEVRDLFLARFDTAR